MKKTQLLGGLALASLLCLSACSSGPKRLSRSWDNHVNRKYAEDSWIHGALLQDILPVYPIVGFVAGFGDALIVNPYFFWTKDLADRKGTAFTYSQADDAEKSVAGWRSPFATE